MTGQQISRRQRGLKQTSEAEQKPKSEAQKKASQAKNAAKKANIAASKPKAAADQPIPAEVAMSASLVVQNYANQNHLAHKQMPPAPVTSTTAAAQRKKKGRRQRVKKMDDADKIILQKLEIDHMLRLRGLVKDCKTHEKYANALHEEFVRYATEKQRFYQNLPEGPKKQLFVERAQRNLKKANEYQARTPSLPPDMFEEYRRIKLDCIQTLQDIETLSLTPEDRKKQRQKAFGLRRKEIEALLRKLKLQEDEDVKRAGMRSVSAGKGDLWSRKPKNGGYPDVPVHGNDDIKEYDERESDYMT
jgi:uncharacterized protein YifN (PemK superfamily)